MTATIAMAGKGGTGKTTIAGLLIRFLLRQGIKPVLAVDADANANLNEVLGVEVHSTVGEAREAIKGEIPGGMTRDLFMEMKLEQALIEAEGYDLIVMGRPEGAGCYCHANTLLAVYMDRLCGNYRVIVMDNEAGMEHISRLVPRRADCLLIVSDPTLRGIQAARRIRDLAAELDLKVSRDYVIINRVRNGLPAAVTEAVDAAGLNLAGVVPEDAILSEYDSEGRPTVELPQDADSVRALEKIFDKILIHDLALKAADGGR
ncbi:MAG: AAA family ATPase [Deltaproteobacteria bacterium]|nr:AAA family ATPase [Deltaproteobacteria bacterium]